MSFDGRNRGVNVWKMLELFGRRVSRLLDAYFILCNDLCLFRIFRYRYIYIYISITLDSSYEIKIFFEIMKNKRLLIFCIGY